MFVALLPEDVTVLVLGEKWLVAAPLLGVFALAAAMRPTIATSAIVLVTRGKAKMLLALTFAHSIVLALLMFASIHWGAVGIAAAKVATTVCLVGPNLYYSFKGSPVTVGAFLSAIRTSLVATVLMSVSLLVFRLSGPSSGPLLTVLVGGGVAGATYLLPWVAMSSGRRELLLIARDLQGALLRRNASDHPMVADAARATVGETLSGYR
jgi:PST family polysaccharide transporter